MISSCMKSSIRRSQSWRVILLRWHLLTRILRFSWASGKDQINGSSQNSTLKSGVNRMLRVRRPILAESPTLLLNSTLTILSLGSTRVKSASMVVSPSVMPCLSALSLQMDQSFSLLSTRLRTPASVALTH